MYAQNYSFMLPLTMHTNGAGGAAAAAAAAALRRHVTGEGVQPHLVLSKSVVDFGARVVLRHQQSKTPYTQEIYVRNNWSSEVQVGGGGLIAGTAWHHIGMAGFSPYCLVAAHLGST